MSGIIEELEKLRQTGCITGSNGSENYYEIGDKLRTAAIAALKSVEAYEGMKEGFAVRIADVEAERDGLKRRLEEVLTPTLRLEEAAPQGDTIQQANAWYAVYSGALEAGMLSFVCMGSGADRVAGFIVHLAARVKELESARSRNAFMDSPAPKMVAGDHENGQLDFV